MIYVCVICMVKRPPLSPMEAEYRRLLEAVVSPVLNTEELKAFEWLLCPNCKPLLEVVHNFQQTALAGVKNLKYLLHKLNTAPIEHRKLGMVTIKIEPNVSTAAPKEEFITDEAPANIEHRKLGMVTVKIEPNVSTAATKEEFITDEATANVDPLTEELVLKFEPKSEDEPELEPELEPDCDSDSKMSCDSNAEAQGNEQPTTSTQQVQVIPKMGATAGDAGKLDVFTHQPQPSQKTVPYLSSIRWTDGVREGSKIRKRKKPSRVACPHCGKFLLATSLGTHINSVHGDGGRCKCDICGKLFRNAVSLRSHKHAHKKMEDMRPELYCQQCAKPFPNRSMLRTHLTTLKHMSRDQYQFECDTCKTKFPDEKRRQQHINVVHLGQKNHKCDQCDKCYGDASSLRHHVAVLHEKRRNLPKHVCHLCGKSFTIRKSLNEHLLTHEGLRPHQCPLCPATFAYKAALYTHNKLKHLKIKGKWKKKKKEGKPKEDKADSND